MILTADGIGIGDIPSQFATEDTEVDITDQSRIIRGRLRVMLRRPDE